jgi:hypothetical protein
MNEIWGGRMGSGWAGDSTTEGFHYHDTGNCSCNIASDFELNFRLIEFVVVDKFLW